MFKGRAERLLETPEIMNFVARSNGSSEVLARSIAAYFLLVWICKVEFGYKRMFLPTQEHRTRYSQRIKICDAGFLSLHLNLRFNKDVSIDIDILNTRQHAFVSVLSRVVSVELGISSVKFTCYQSKVLTEYSATSKTSSVSELFYFICYLLLCPFAISKMALFA